jgi:hypothetical protein
MPKFKVGGSFGYVGTHWEDIFEADTAEDAEEQARDYMMERIEWWVNPEPVDDDDDPDKAA